MRLLRMQATLYCALSLLLIYSTHLSSAVQISTNSIKTLPFLPLRSKPSDFLIRNAEAKDVEFISRMVTKELTDYSKVSIYDFHSMICTLNDSLVTQSQDVPFWKMPLFLLEESTCRIQFYERQKVLFS